MIVRSSREEFLVVACGKSLSKEGEPDRSAQGGHLIDLQQNHLIIMLPCRRPKLVNVEIGLMYKCT